MHLGAQSPIQFNTETRQGLFALYGAVLYRMQQLERRVGLLLTLDANAQERPDGMAGDHAYRLDDSPMQRAKLKRLLNTALAPADLIERLLEVLGLSEWLAHDFWRDRAAQLLPGGTDGAGTLLTELTAYHRTLLSLDRELAQATEEWLASHGCCHAELPSLDTEIIDPLLLTRVLRVD